MMNSTFNNKQNVLKFFKFYILGFLISLSLLLVVHTYGYLIDSIYSYQKFSESFLAVVIFAFPFALHLWIIKNLSHSKTFAQASHQLLFKILASYWIGNILSLMIMGVLYILGLFVTLPLIKFITEDRLISLSLLAGIPVSILYYVYEFDSWYDDKRKDKAI